MSKHYNHLNLKGFNFNKLYIFNIKQYTNTAFVPQETKVQSLSPTKTVFLDDHLQGKASKVLAKIYTFNDGRRSNPSAWPKYFCKFGHKCYPSESITEHLIGELAQSLEFVHAETDLATIGGKIFLLSKNFRSKNYSLVHGAEVYAGYLKDSSFVEEIGDGKEQKEFFNIEDTKKCFAELYSNHLGLTIYQDFIKMLLFDAIVGNNDRHMYNWGILEDARNKEAPKFSPIYDSARGLLWNHTEARIKREMNNKSHPYEKKLTKYARKSTPKIGYQDNTNCNHFELIDYLNRTDHEAGKVIQKYFLSKDLLPVLTKTVEDFTLLMSKRRIDAIKKYLGIRIELLHKSLTD